MLILHTITWRHVQEIWLFVLSAILYLLHINRVPTQSTIDERKWAALMWVRKLSRIRQLANQLINESSIRFNWPMDVQHISWWGYNSIYQRTDGYIVQSGGQPVIISITACPSVTLLPLWTGCGHNRELVLSVYLVYVYISCFLYHVPSTNKP